MRILKVYLYRVQSIRTTRRTTRDFDIFVISISFWWLSFFSQTKKVILDTMVPIWQFCLIQNGGKQENTWKARTVKTAVRDVLQRPF